MRRVPLAATALYVVVLGCTAPSHYVLDDASSDAVTDVARDGADAGPTFDVLSPDAGTVDAGPGDLGADVAADLPMEEPLVCPGGRYACGGRCVDLLTEPAHCDECNNHCDGICDGGGCAPLDASAGCGTGHARCGDGCVDLATDPLNCGECGNGCTGRCVAGGCVPEDAGATCPRGQSLCVGGCTDTATDPANCGECGNVCATGCHAGGCATP